MEIKVTTQNELTKAAKLITKAASLGMDISGYGELAVNNTSGNVYLWAEDYPFCLFIGLYDSRVMACYSCPENGKEFIRVAGNNLNRLYKWCEKLESRNV